MAARSPEGNESIFKQVLDDQEFQDTLKDFYVRKMYSGHRSAENTASGRLTLTSKVGTRAEGQ